MSLRATNGEILSNERPVVTNKSLKVGEGAHVFSNAGGPLLSRNFANSAAAGETTATTMALRLTSTSNVS